MPRVCVPWPPAQQPIPAREHPPAARASTRQAPSRARPPCRKPARWEGARKAHRHAGQTWLNTGCPSGLAHSLAKAVPEEGHVADSQGPLIGATVMEKGTNNGTVTDFNGNFSLN
ncbi:MAG: carboxypeptidase-like regulatory domain-containing protein, partial [Desulfovibrio sp.]|nr:carboxypeptidase-like regulatory domain-containing protein [Desulfovibrio sp.]